MNINSIESNIKSEMTVWTDTFNMNDVNTVKAFQKYMKKDFFKTWNVMPAFHNVMYNAGHCYEVIGITNAQIYKNTEMTPDYFNENSGYCDIMITAVVRNYSRVMVIMFSLYEEFNLMNKGVTLETFSQD